VFKPAHLLALFEVAVARNRRRVPGIHYKIKEAQADTGNKNGRHGHKSNDMTRLFESRANYHPLVSAEEPVNMGECGGIYVKRISMNMPDLIDTQ
jgi:hypothetical protein